MTTPESVRAALDTARAACPACGRTFEPPVTLSNGVRLAGHVQGGPLCVRPPKFLPRRRSPIDAHPDPEPLTPEQREAKAERIREKLREQMADAIHAQVREHGLEPFITRERRRGRAL